MGEPLNYDDVRVFRPIGARGIVLVVLLMVGSLTFPVLGVAPDVRRGTALPEMAIVGVRVMLWISATSMLLYMIYGGFRISGEYISHRWDLRRKTIPWRDVQRVVFFRNFGRLIGVRVYPPRRGGVLLIFYRRRDREEIEALIRAHVPAERIVEKERMAWILRVGDAGGRRGNG